jgi:anaerobic magnesium-protoporphyrin IX monomethyl ester cyclase
MPPTATIPRAAFSPARSYDPHRRTARPGRVVLIRPAFVTSRFIAYGFLTPPLGVAYLAAALRQAGHSVRVVDAVGEALNFSRDIGNGLIRNGLPDDEIVDRVGPAPDVIGVTCLFSNDWPYVRRLIRRLKAAYPTAAIVGGGEHFTAEPEESLRSCPELTACALGEGEQTLLDLVDAFVSGGDPRDVSGLAIRAENGRPQRTARRGRVRNVDDLPLPAWDLVPLEEYLRRGLGMGMPRGRSIPMLASRGCPYQCTFCSSVNMWTVQWIARDPGKVLDEFQLWQNRYGVTDVQFFDLTAIIRKDWILRFADEIARRDLRLTWQLPVGTRSEAIDRETAAALKRSGCFYLCYAPESGSRAILERVKKRVDLEKMKSSMRDCLKEGLRIKCNMVLGFPGETHAQTRETLRFTAELARLGVHDVALFPFSPYPGSPLFDELKTRDEIPGAGTDAWYASLAYWEFFGRKSYAGYSPALLRAYQFAGFVLFYGLSFLCRPARLVRFLLDLFTRTHTTKGSAVLSQFLRRAVRGGKAVSSPAPEFSTP